MSRLIIKNLPNGMKEEHFRTMFAAFGTLTDCGLKFTKEGKFRKFGFVGFKSEEDAERALKHFHKSFVDTSRITVEQCKSFGDPTKARAWSKHSRGSAARNSEQLGEKKAAADQGLKKEKQVQKEQKGQKGQKGQKEQKEQKEQKGQKGQKEQKEQKEQKGQKGMPPTLGKLEGDEGFQEFLAVHQNRAQAPTWANDTAADPAAAKPHRKDRKKKAASDDYLNFDSESESEEPEQDEEEEEEDKDQGEKTEHLSPGKEALKTGLSDMDYLRSKVVRQQGESEEEEDDDEELVTEKEPVPAQPLDSAYESGDKDTAHKSKAKLAKAPRTQETEPTTEFTVKLRGAPFNVTEQQVREFLVPLKPVAIRIVRNAHGNKTGYVFVDFQSEEEVEKALRRNKDYMGGRYIEVFRVDHALQGRAEGRGREERSWHRELKEDEEEEEVSESGRLFVRNLSYTCSEQDLSELFSKYGPLAETHFPIDSLTKKPKGFAFVTYMIPEHAVKALAELDGHVFQGRMLHILPSTMKKQKTDQDSDAQGSSYKKQKDAKDKASSGSSHNWNTLFLGTSAVADAIAEKYNTTKSRVLDDESRGSVAVRMALGETQIVQETRQFLLDNGVSLDSFSQAAGPRNTTVLLVKNLPAGVQVAELEAVFSPLGSLGRVLLPPSGLTAIVEFLEPAEAKRAFSRLAYTKFQHVPLYLEWAPMGVFTQPAPAKQEQPPTDSEQVPESESKTAAEAQSSEEEEESIPGCTLFIKNLSFSTTEETLKSVFSKCGAVKSCTISKKKDRAGALLSMGYGFVEFKSPTSAQKALRQLQHCTVDDHQLEVKISERATKPVVVSSRKKQMAKKQTTSKILVRNIPFQATGKELRELFSTFGELKTLRLPKKVSGTGAHRGFGFVDFLTKQDAKKAFSALCHSTHLYGRRLVLEWADSEETLETLRRKTAEHFHDAPKRKKQSEVMEDIMEQIEAGEEED
ncbi:probable RNA-binding protein 19 isoform X2 [Lepisosteus oculatus]|uniref:probable RNA-binding protein 19 isoform X2 n=1 Tax=Lepisosteus oculatus TaxID=7918 RepID=UPI0035F529DC